jgi:hypothetical protein
MKLQSSQIPIFLEISQNNLAISSNIFGSYLAKKYDNRLACLGPILGNLFNNVLNFAINEFFISMIILNIFVY